MSSRSSARWTSCSARSTDETRTATSDRRVRAAGAVSPSRRRTWRRCNAPIAQISAGPAGERGDCRCSIWRSARCSGRLAAPGSPRMDEVADLLEMPPIRVYEVATFYTMFNLQPVGQIPAAGLHHDAVLAARLGRGRRRLRAQARHRHRRDDAGRAVHHDEVECLGACVNAPILQVNDDFYEDLDGRQTEAAARGAARGEPPQPGSHDGRQTSRAGSAGRPTLTDAATRCGAADDRC